MNFSIIERVETPKTDIYHEEHPLHHWALIIDIEPMLEEYKTIGDNVIDTSNKFLVGVGMRGLETEIRPMVPVRNLSPDDALLLAAWLVVLATPFTKTKFEDIRSAVESN